MDYCLVKSRIDDRPVLILGGGPAAGRIAARLAGLPVEAQEGHADPARLDLLTDGITSPVGSDAGTRLQRCSGHAGAFKVVLLEDGRQKCLFAAALVIAGDHRMKANFESHGLRETEHIWSLSRFEQHLAGSETSENEALTGQACVVFANSWLHESHPAITERLLRSCLQIQQRGGVRTFFLTGNLKVAAFELEELCLQAKKQGTMFFKFTDTFPVVRILEDGRASFDCPDESGRMMLEIAADLTVVDETPEPAEIPPVVVSGLGLECDSLSFAQSENVHRLPNWTNRRGVFVAGAARAVMSMAAQLADADQVALKVAEFLAGRDREDLPAVEIHPERCARCLTCFRLCPYRAIEVGSRMRVIAEACWACGRCAAECPGRAIEMGQSADTQLEAAGRSENRPAAAGPPLPRMAVMCCTRSAGYARRQSQTLNKASGAEIVFIEGLCGGGFGARHLLKAFESGLDGVLVLTCHNGNCHSGNGPQHARKNTEAVREALCGAGIEGERLGVASIAANMEVEFRRVVGGFAEKLANLRQA